MTKDKNVNNAPENGLDILPGQSIVRPDSSEFIDAVFDCRRFGGDILANTVGQGILLLLSFVMFLIIPKHLSINDYGYYQTFMLYSSYVGILHLGFIDGVLIRWAGKDLSRVGGEVRPALLFLLLQQIIFITPLILILYLMLELPIMWIAVMILVYALIENLRVFFVFTSQAVRKFRLLALTKAGKGASLLIFMIIFFNLGYADFQHVIFAFLASSFLLLLTLAVYFRKYLSGKMQHRPHLMAYGKGNINTGIFVLLGNFILMLFLTVDRLMVNFFFSLENFAIYSFAVTATVVIYTFIRAISQVFFPYLSAITPNSRVRAYHLSKPVIIIVWAAVLTLYFPLVSLLQSYLPKYITSLPIMQVLIGTIGFGSLIQILHVSYFKVYGKQRQYFICGITSVSLSIVFNLWAITVWGSLQSVAMATLISSAIWYIFNEVSLKSVVAESNRNLWKGVTVLGCYLGSFWLASFLSDWFTLQMLLYLGFFSLITWLFLRQEIKDLVKALNRPGTQQY
ncbi:lipopolysaccharide biosynthesis protein [Chloroflexota bacterium]